MSASPRPVGFYVHHHGSGHANRCRLLASRLPEAVSVHVFTSAPDSFVGWSRGTIHVLPPDTSPDRDPSLDLLDGAVIHYAPTDLPGLQDRMAILAGWFATARPSLFVVDLSVEVALFARLCGVRTALVRLHGHRDDPAHLAAFRLAHRLFAPFPAALEDAHTPEWVREKTTYLGAFSRYDGRTETRHAAREALGIPQTARVVTIINGTGGGAQVQARWRDVARATPTWTFRLVGVVDDAEDGPANLTSVGFVTDTYPQLKAADVVIGSGGTNTMMEIGAARVPYLSVPEPRPFDEQLCKMRALAALGLTRIVDPDLPPAAWSALLEHTRVMDTSGWDNLFDAASPAIDPFRDDCADRLK